MLADASIHGSIRLLVNGVRLRAMQKLLYLQNLRPARFFAADVPVDPRIRGEDVQWVGLAGELSLVNELFGRAKRCPRPTEDVFPSARSCGWLRQSGTPNNTV